MLLNRTKATKAEKTGDKIQVVPISETLCQLTASNERQTTVNPMIAPIIEGVVDTGQPKADATNNQIPADKSADIIPKTKTSELLVN